MSGDVVSVLVAGATLLVVAASLAAVVLPLRRPTTAAGAAMPPSTAAPEWAALLEERAAALAALRELDFDYALGKLAEADYHAVRERYERRALALLKATDALSREAARAGYDQPARLQESASGSLAAPGRHAGAEQPGAPDGIDHARRSMVSSEGALAARRNGTAAAAPSRSRPAAQPRPADRRLALGAGLAAVVFLAAVAGLYLSGSRAQSAQRPLAVLAGIGPRALAVVPGASPRVVLASAAGLWTSADAGASWQPVADVEGTLRAVAVSPARPARVYAAGPGRLVVSDDGGYTWRTQPLPLPAADEMAAPLDVRALAAHPADADRLWLVAEGAGVWRSTDGGQTWTRTSAQAPANATALAVVAEPGLALYLASATEGVQASLDEGRTWAPASGMLNGALPTRRVAALVFDTASGDVATTPDGRALHGTLYAATDLGVYRSVDRGQTWARLSLTASVAAVAAGDAPSGRMLLAVDREGQVYRSLDRGVTWDGG